MTDLAIKKTNGPCPQKWPDCEPGLALFIENFAALLDKHLGYNLVGVYLHGSLAMGSYYSPKSDIDLIAVIHTAIPIEKVRELNQIIARYAERLTTAGKLEFSIITAEAAKNLPDPMPYVLHYSAMVHSEIINDSIQYYSEQYDADLHAHILCVKKRGCCILGSSISEVFGDVRWKMFMQSILDDLNWILSGDNILEMPYYGILNTCRVFQHLSSAEQTIRSKDEGGLWGLQNFPDRFTPLINTALSIYRSDLAVSESERKTGGIVWDDGELVAFRDYVRARLDSKKTK